MTTAKTNTTTQTPPETKTQTPPETKTQTPPEAEFVVENSPPYIKAFDAALSAARSNVVEGFDALGVVIKANSVQEAMTTQADFLRSATTRSLEATRELGVSFSEANKATTRAYFAKFDDKTNPMVSWVDDMYTQMESVYQSFMPSNTR